MLKVNSTRDLEISLVRVDLEWPLRMLFRGLPFSKLRKPTLNILAVIKVILDGAPDIEVTIGRVTDVELRCGLD